MSVDIAELIIKETLTWARTELAETSSSVPLDCELLLAFVLKKERIYLWTWPEKEISHNELLQFESLMFRPSFKKRSLMA